MNEYIDLFFDGDDFLVGGWNEEIDEFNNFEELFLVLYLICGVLDECIY